jgi:ubiquinone/menaquinone biosynthesis C-methylase UbiE
LSYNYDFHWREKAKLPEDPNVAQKAKIFLEIIPDECVTIADIGCGNGAITNVLAEKFNVGGIDVSRVALKCLSTKASPIVGSADRLPIRDKSADVVLSSELLEHLTNELFLKAVSEIKRTSKRYVLISVPNNEKLRRRYTKCNSCGFEFHIYGHLRSFNLRKIAAYFDGYAIKYSTILGALEEKSFDTIYYLKNKLANSYFFVKTVLILCPNCGDVLKFPLRRNILQKSVSFFLTKLQQTLNALLQKKPEPDWLLVLFEKID